MSINRDDWFDNQMFINTKETLNDDKETSSQKLVKLDGFRGFVESMVEEIILEEKPFDSYKEELKLQCEKQGVDYHSLEYNLEDFLENLDMGIKSPDGLAIAMAMAHALEDAEKCYVREEKIDEITNIWNACHPNKEFHPHNMPLWDDGIQDWRGLLYYLEEELRPLVDELDEKIDDLEHKICDLGFKSNPEGLERLRSVVCACCSELYRFLEDCEKNL